MRRAHINGVELDIHVSGSGDPVLLIAPILADGMLPLSCEPALMNSHRLIRYHRRGWAGSTHTAPPVSIADHAEDAAALLEHLDVGPSHLVGHSSGATIALQLAADRPDLVQSLVLLEPTLFGVPSAAALLERAGPALEAFRSGDAETAVERFLSVVSGLDRDNCRSTIEGTVPGAIAGAVRDADTLFGIELPAVGEWQCGLEQTARIEQPVLCVLGEETGTLWREVAVLLHEWFPQIEDLAVPGVGHLLHLQRPEPVAKGIAEFLARHPAAGTPDRPGRAPRSPVQG